MIKKHSGERGNALFLILIAVALFAALSYAVSQTGRGSGTVDKETSMISSGSMTQYPALLRDIVVRMVVSGVDVNTITFTYPPTGQIFEIFDPQGGGMVFDRPPPGIGGTVTDWTFESATPAAGYYIKDIGTNADTGREVLAALHGISLTSCKQINKGLGLTPTPVVVTTATVWGAPLATYNPAAANTISGAGLDGKAFACMENGGLYDYFHALAEQ